MARPADVIDDLDTLDALETRVDDALDWWRRHPTSAHARAAYLRAERTYEAAAEDCAARYLDTRHLRAV